MTVSRRSLILAAGTAALGGAVDAAAATPAADPDAAPARSRRSTGSVHTLNGWSLPHTMKAGVKEFHLVAEEVDHEFAPGCKAKCWGYNGGTPGPTLEAVEGDRVRILVTNRLPEPTSIHWHGILLPSGMDGVSGLSQPAIGPGETFAYEFTLRQHGTHMYHPHADEMVQMAVGMMGLFIIHPAAGEAEPIDRDFAFLLHNWSLHPGTHRPDPSIMLDFDLWTFNSKVFPAIEPLVVRAGERVRIRIGNLSMYNHPIHFHGHQFDVTGSDGGRWPRQRWRQEVTELIAVGQTRDLEFMAVPGDWALHCHMSHHTMNAMGHGIPNVLGARISDSDADLESLLPGMMNMGSDGMSAHQEHVEAMNLPGPANTLPMMGGTGPYGTLEMGGMFTVVKVRRGLAVNDYRDPGWYQAPAGSVAALVSEDPNFGKPVRRTGVPAPTEMPSNMEMPMDHSQMDHSSMKPQE